ncbi:MAG: TerB family tellurite resistance protein [Spirochaetales bacterium]|jgi:uncharacterized tellurite resistance protein B-like protein|nr:TerB family tellurite resistance protein [Spirochaetales bacterium]
MEWTEAEKAVCIRAVSMVANADHNIDDKEKQFLFRGIKNLGNVPEDFVVKHFENPGTFDAIIPEIGRLHDDKARFLIEYCFGMAIADEEIVEQEIKVLFKIAELYLVTIDYDIFKKYLQAKKDVRKFEIELFPPIIGEINNRE